MTEPTTIRGALMHLASALFFWARWALATALLYTSAVFVRLARNVAPQPFKMPKTAP